ncbi:hypothetical protein FPQ18DRAFT_4579 [Pyronema domesticum]|uniref:Uncharacterized protein n=1 Tax=Pyronema omphalodes (strain CBS 100304) TaxID=1076935 RepID=U4LM40_PYROM|nr:hypothetical protein FPQ18DRAFT_4579 [Pyronema domesticum]CCX32657.1 Similar to hypothetical protein NEUTE1DRAFT_78506 [Neurospora tetrasperma FGSC 2508]; acc. no. EGO58943 [Pyronema omphalodes CBS 100304]
MAGVFDKNKNLCDSKRPGELGFEYGTSEMLTAQDLTDGVYEDPHDLRHMASDYPSNRGSSMLKDHHGGHNPAKAFTSKGAVGKEFNADGAIGQVPQKIGGAFDKNGSIGKQFTDKGAIGGTTDKVLGEK